jgi:hypothetical protein
MAAFTGGLKMSQKPIEERLNDLQPSPSVRFYKRMARAAWTRPAIARRRAYAFSGLTLMLAIALVVFTPQGRTLAQGLIQLFTRAESDSLPVQAWQLTPVPATESPDPGFIFNQVMTDVGKQAGFDVLEPAWMPGILSFDGASYDPNLNIVRIFYRYNLGGTDMTNGLVVRQEPFQTTDDCELCGLVGASAEIETTQIGTTTGEYVVGVWKLTDSGPVWESDPYMQTLRWQAGGMAFELSYMGDPTDVTRDDLIAIAESMK